MSGIELAGIVLGAFPLLISALEHYRETAEVLEDWWQIKKEYKKCKNEIKVQELAFENNLERFLLPLIVDDHDIAALIADPGGDKWKDPGLEVKLKDRLPKSYELFLDTISDINATMDGLKDELGIRREGFQQGLTSKSEPVSLPFLEYQNCILSDHVQVKNKVEKPTEQVDASTQIRWQSAEYTETRTSGAVCGP